MDKMEKLQFKSIIEQKIGWGYIWEVEKSELIELLVNYPFILIEVESDYLHTINYLQSFQELKQLTARRIDDMNDFIDAEFFIDNEVFNDYKKEVERTNNRKQLQSVLYSLELETSFKLTLDLNILNDTHTYYDKLNIVTWKNGGAQYDFTVELDEVL